MVEVARKRDQHHPASGSSASSAAPVLPLPSKNRSLRHAARRRPDIRTENPCVGASYAGSPDRWEEPGTWPPAKWGILSQLSAALRRRTGRYVDVRISHTNHPHLFWMAMGCYLDLWYVRPLMGTAFRSQNVGTQKPPCANGHLTVGEWGWPDGVDA